MSKFTLILASLFLGLTIAQAEPERRQRCLAAARGLRDGLRSAGIAVPDVTGPILPLVVGGAARATDLSHRLFADHGILVTAIRPPTVPEGTARLRVTTNAELSDDDLERAATALAAVVR